MCERRFVLTNTNEQSIEPILEYLDDPFANEPVDISLVNNVGGDIVPALLLIERIRYSELPITINVSGFVFSAAAVLYFAIVFGKDEGAFESVNVGELDAPILVMFHKPRRVNGSFIGFPDASKKARVTAIPLDIEGQSKVVEQVFKRFLGEVGADEIKEVPEGEDFVGMKHTNQHIWDCWESNFDCIFQWSGRSS